MKKALLLAILLSLAAPTPARQQAVHNRPAASVNLCKSERGDFGLWYNRVRWEPDAEEIKASGTILRHSSRRALALVTFEQSSEPLETVKEALLQNARESDRAASITHEESRTVNSRQMLCLTVELKVKGEPTVWYGYYYSGKEGSIRATTVSDKRAFKEFEQELTDLLDGVEIFAPGSDAHPGVLPAPPPGARDGIGAGPADAPPAPRHTVDKKPSMLNFVRPTYTEEARRHKVAGVVVIRIVIGTDGMVKGARIIRGLPYGLNEEALATVYKMLFEPALINGQPVAYSMQVEIEFHLK